MFSWKDHRLTVANILPPVFICAVVGTIWSVYIRLHLMPMLELSSSTVVEEMAIYNKGLLQTCISQIFTAMFVICFIRAVLAKPGSVPEEPEWLVGSKASLTAELNTRELKGSTGDRRFCKWCSRYKPDRCHHCRICKSCVLKMDHHCPWIMNCVGFGNHKFFFLLVCYAVADCLFIIFTLTETVKQSVLEETAPTNRFLLVLGLTLAIIMGVLMSTFLSFHTWLMMKGMTTIEFCEKSMSSSRFEVELRTNGVSYDLGCLMNLKAVFGPRWWLWLLPVSPPEGNGVIFGTAKSIAEQVQEQAEPEWTGHEQSASA